MPLIDLGAQAFNQGHYFEAHEFWEALWVQNKGPKKHYLQALILACGALIHLQKGNFETSKKLSVNCKKKLEKGEPFGIRIQGLEKFLELIMEDLWSQAKIQMPDLRANPLE